MKQIKRILSVLLCILMLTSAITCLSYAIDWSDWTEDGSNFGSDQYEYESKTQISTRTKEYTKSTLSTMDGWTRDDSKTTSTIVWSGNTEWYDSQRSTSETYRYKGTRDVYVGVQTYLYRYYNPTKNDFRTWGGDGYYEDGYWVFDYYKFDKYSSGQDLYMSDEITSIGSDYPCWKGGTREAYKTQYGYERGTKVYTYTFYRWTNWSEWTDGTGTNNDSTRVRTVYRYRLHDWDNGTDNPAATCSKTGVRTYTCKTNGCSATKTETIPINSNNHVNTENHDVVPSTYTVKGYTAGVYCNDCKTWISGHEELPLLTQDDTDPTNQQNDPNAQQDDSTGSKICKWCGERHRGFLGMFVSFYHLFLVFLFGSKY